MYCQKCGNKIDDNDMYCAKCGNKIKKIQPIIKDTIVESSDKTVSTTTNSNGDKRILKRLVIIVASCSAIVLIILAVVLNGRNNEIISSGTQPSMSSSIDKNEPFENNDISSSASKTVKPTIDIIQEPTQNEPKEQIKEQDNKYAVQRTDSYRILNNNYIDEYEKNSFCNDVEWATLYDETSKEYSLGVINRQGQVVYIADQFGHQSDVKEIYRTPFYKGLSFADNRTIINSLGEEVYNLTDSSMSIVGYADDGNFIIIKHDAGGFDKAESDWFYILDDDLNLQQTDIEFTKNTWIKQIYSNTPIYRLADGFYYLDYNRVGAYLNINNGSWILGTPNSIDLLSYNDEYAKIEREGYFYLVPIDLLKTAMSYDDIINMLDNENVVFLGSSGSKRGLWYENVDEGYRVLNNLYYMDISDWNGTSILRKISSDSRDQIYYEYVDLNGNIIIRYPEFDEAVSYDGASGFTGGYAALYLIGADEKKYVTIIDEKGEIQYTPLQVEYYNYWVDNENHICSCNGYIFAYSNDNVTVVNPEGEIIRLGDKLDGLENTNYYANFYDFSLGISEGVIYVRQKNKVQQYYVDGGMVEDAVAQYNRSGEMVFTDSDGSIVVDHKQMLTKDSDIPTDTSTQVSNSNLIQEDNSYELGDSEEKTVTAIFFTLDGQRFVSIDDELRQRLEEKGFIYESNQCNYDYVTLIKLINEAVDTGTDVLWLYYPYSGDVVDRALEKAKEKGVLVYSFPIEQDIKDEDIMNFVNDIVRSL